MNLTIKVENAYSDGHESERVEAVEVEPFGDDLEGLWEQLAVCIGDGHGSGRGRDLGYCHTVTIVESVAHPELVGQSNEWVGA